MWCLVEVVPAPVSVLPLVSLLVLPLLLLVELPEPEVEPLA